MMKILKNSAGCPACAHRFVAWRVWMISRWSCIRCPGCDVRLIRRADRQAYLVGLTGFVLLQPAVMSSVPMGWRIGSAVAAILIVWAIDAVTVRLVEARRRGRILGYEAVKQDG